MTYPTINEVKAQIRDICAALDTMADGTEADASWPHPALQERVERMRALSDALIKALDEDVLTGVHTVTWWTRKRHIRCFGPSKADAAREAFDELRRDGHAVELKVDSRVIEVAYGTPPLETA